MGIVTYNGSARCQRNYDEACLFKAVSVINIVEKTVIGLLLLSIKNVVDAGLSPGYRSRVRSAKMDP